MKKWLKFLLWTAIVVVLLFVLSYLLLGIMFSGPNAKERGIRSEAESKIVVPILEENVPDLGLGEPIDVWTWNLGIYYNALSGEEVRSWKTARFYIADKASIESLLEQYFEDTENIDYEHDYEGKKYVPVSYSEMIDDYPICFFMSVYVDDTDTFSYSGGTLANFFTRGKTEFEYNVRSNIEISDMCSRGRT